MHLIIHPKQFKEGTRVLFLKGRHKDGIENERMLTRLSHDPTQFDRSIAEFVALARPGERIYASAGARDVRDAARWFKQRQIDADYDPDPLHFYRNLYQRWASALMQPGSQAEKFWLIDCDTPEHVELTRHALLNWYDRELPPYWYETKSGQHCIIQPFNRSRIDGRVAALMHDNPIMLWGY